MIDLRKLIIERIKTHGCGGCWLLDVFRHLIDHGAAPDDAINALSLFVDEAIAMKARRGEVKELS
jgi:hypothetical protein